MAKSSKKSATEQGLYFLPLGGSEQFGVNLNAYISSGQILVVDCGMGFADERYPGIDLVLPDPSYLEARRHQLKGLIITHAHEDHIGAVGFLWERLHCPLYATPFTAAVLREKFEEQKIRKPPIHVVQPMQTIKLGNFSVQFVPVSHSIPDSCALLIETPEGRVLHSADWNTDPKPVAGYKTDAQTFKDIGKKGILAYVGDSTNAQVPGRAGSESEIEQGLINEFQKCKGRIAVTAFSSNIGRIQSISRAAKAVGRDVGIIGRSLHRMIGCAVECGYLRDVREFVPEDELEDHPAEKLVMIVTGSQGEARSALSKIARAEHPSMRLGRGDTVIFSARPIPGNEKEINAVKNNLIAGGVRVVSAGETENVIHVSGHPCREEIGEMLQWLRPNTVIPVHGERQQLDAHADFARECQVPNVIVPNNGSLIKLAPGTPQVVDHIETGLLAVDQKRIIPATHHSISARRKLQYTGVVHISLVLDKDGHIQGDLRLDTMGLIDEEMPGEIQIEDNLYHEMMDALQDMRRDKLRDDEFIEEELRVTARRFISDTLGIKPKVSVHVIRI